MSTQILYHKLETEEFSVDIDMLSRLSLGESVVSAACAMSVLSGTDANPNGMLSGLPSVSGSIVSQKVIGGSSGNIYEIHLSIRTSLNNILVNKAKLAVLPDSAVTPP